MNTNTTSRSLLLVGLVLVSVLAGAAVAGTVAAQNATDNGTSNDTNGTMGTPDMNGTMGTPGMNGTMGANASGDVTITAEPAAAGASSNHTVNITVGSNAPDMLTGVLINYSGTNASTAVAPGYVQTITLSGQSLAANQTTGSPSGLNGNTMNFTFDTNESLGALEQGDQISIVYQQVTNPPEPGNYSVSVTLNPLNDSVNMTGFLDITEAMTTTTGMMDGNETTGMMDGNETTGMMDGNETTGMMDGNETTGMMDGNETTAEETPTEEDTATEAAATTTSSGNGPGFTAFAALVAVLAAALLATRRS